jgi:hypothetical protein
MTSGRSGDRSVTAGCRFNAEVQASIVRAMDEPEPMPVFTFNPDGPTMITYPDGTVSVNDPRPDDRTATTSAVPGDGDAGWRHIEHDVSAGLAGASAGSDVPCSAADWRYRDVRHRHDRFRARRGSRRAGHK